MNNDVFVLKMKQAIELSKNRGDGNYKVVKLGRKEIFSDKMKTHILNLYMNKGYTQRQIAEVLQVSQTTISKIVINKIKEANDDY